MTAKSSFAVRWWFLLALAGLPMMVGLGRSIRERWRTVPGLCRRCGYDLRATPTRCPECGTPA